MSSNEAVPQGDSAAEKLKKIDSLGRATLDMEQLPDGSWRVRKLPIEKADGASAQEKES